MVFLPFLLIVCTFDIRGKYVRLYLTFLRKKCRKLPLRCKPKNNSKDTIMFVQHDALDKSQQPTCHHFHTLVAHDDKKFNFGVPDKLSQKSRCLPFAKRDRETTNQENAERELNHQQSKTKQRGTEIATTLSDNSDWKRALSSFCFSLCLFFSFFLFFSYSQSLQLPEEKAPRDRRAVSSHQALFRSPKQTGGPFTQLQASRGCPSRLATFAF